MCINFHTGNKVIINGCGMPFGGFGPCGFGGFSPGCFGYGFSSGNMFEIGAGMGLGYAAGMTLIPALPAIFKGIGQGCSWVWNKAIVPAGRAVGKACSWVWNKGIVPAAKWIGNGVKNLWNKIFHKEPKTKAADNQK